MAAPEPGRAYTPEQASEWLGGWSPGGIRMAAKRGRIPHTRIAGRICLTAEDIAAILAAGHRDPVDISDQPSRAPRRARRPAPPPTALSSSTVRPLVARKRATRVKKRAG